MQSLRRRLWFTLEPGCLDRRQGPGGRSTQDDVNAASDVQIATTSSSCAKENGPTESPRNENKNHHHAISFACSACGDGGIPCKVRQAGRGGAAARRVLDAGGHSWTVRLQCACVLHVLLVVCWMPTAEPVLTRQARSLQMRDAALSLQPSAAVQDHVDRGKVGHDTAQSSLSNGGRGTPLRRRGKSAASAKFGTREQQGAPVQKADGDVRTSRVECDVISPMKRMAMCVSMIRNGSTHPPGEAKVRDGASYSSVVSAGSPVRVADADGTAAGRQSGILIRPAQLPMPEVSADARDAQDCDKKDAACADTARTDSEHGEAAEGRRSRKQASGAGGMREQGARSKASSSPEDQLRVSAGVAGARNAVSLSDRLNAGKPGSTESLEDGRKRVRLAESERGGSSSEGATVAAAAAAAAAAGAGAGVACVQDRVESRRNQTSSQQRIKVCVRKRPLSDKEVAAESKDVILCNTASGSGITVLEYRKRLDLTEYVEPHAFEFDAVLSHESSNEAVYRQTTRELVRYVFASGGKATVFAYGQTGAGKTFTMMGGKGQPGLYMLAAEDIFEGIGGRRAAGDAGEQTALGVVVSFFEIYGGKLFDLLNNRKPLVKREDGNNKVQIRGLSEHAISSADELMNAIAIGHEARSIAATEANLDSSRSHAILQVTLRAHGGEGEVRGKISFVDLAGSERAADTGKNVDRTRRLEAADINKSLLALKECIRALAEDATHIPFRGSVLTSVLKDSFIGKCRTVMIANISPDITATEHTMNTLRYADRVKQIKGTLTAELEQAAAARKVTERPMRVLGTRVPTRRSLHEAALTHDRERIGLQGAGRSAVQVVASAACRMARGLGVGGETPLRIGGADRHGAVGREEREGRSGEATGGEAAIAEQLAALHKRHIYDTSVLLQKEREILALASRASSSGSNRVSYLASLAKLLQHKAGMVTRMLSLLPSEVTADDTAAGNAR